VYPDVSELKKKNPAKTAFMSYREKEWKREGKKYRINQRWVPLRATASVKAVRLVRMISSEPRRVRSNNAEGNRKRHKAKV
jgi:hypothetical protein